MIKEMIAKIEVFKQEFLDSFGITPDVTVVIGNESIKTHTVYIDDLKYAIDFLFKTDETIPIEIRNLGLWSNSRKRDIVLYKYCLCQIIMKNRFYTYAFVGNKMNYNHTSIIHAVTSIDNLLETKDERTTYIYKRIKNFTDDTDFRNKIPDESDNG